MRPAESQMAGGYYYSGFVLSFAGREWGVDSLFALDASILSRDPITSLVPKPASAVFLNLVSVRPPEPSVNPTNNSRIMFMSTLYGVKKFGSRLHGASWSSCPQLCFQSSCRLQRHKRTWVSRVKT